VTAWTAASVRPKQEYDKAIKDFDEAIRLDPNNEMAFNNRGLAWPARRVTRC